MTHQGPSVYRRLNYPLIHSLINKYTTQCIASLTCLVLSGIVGNLHGVNLQPLGAFTDVVDPGDVGTLFIDHLHHLEIGDEWSC